jgi:hypothetical protein
MHNFSRNNGKKKLSCNFLPSFALALQAAMVCACPVGDGSPAMS